VCASVISKGDKKGVRETKRSGLTYGGATGSSSHPRAALIIADLIKKKDAAGYSAWPLALRPQQPPRGYGGFKFFTPGRLTMYLGMGDGCRYKNTIIIRYIMGLPYAIVWSRL